MEPDMAMQEPGAAQLAAVLQVLLANWPDHSGKYGVPEHIRTVCALLQASKACRAAMQQSTAVSCVHFSGNFPGGRHLNRLAGFTAWLPHHPGLVRSLQLTGSWAKHWTAGEQLLPGALLQYLALRGPESAAVAGAAASKSLPVVGLQHLRTPWPTIPAVFTTLAAAASVTSLQLDLQQAGLPSPAVCTALGALHSLRELRLADSSPLSTVLAMPAALATALQQLPHLTLLETALALTPEQLQQLPHSLQQLDVTLAPAEGGTEDVQAELTHLTALTSLSLQSAAATVPAHWVLPDSLLKLGVTGPSHAPCSTRLQSLELQEPHLCPELIEQLPRLPQLLWLELTVGSSLPEAEVAHLLPVAAAVGGATALTGLAFDAILAQDASSAHWRSRWATSSTGV